MTELEKANKTIEELLRINEELAGTNGQKEKARLRIYELEAKLQKAIEEREKFRWKLIHREEVLKEAVKEAIREIVLHDEDGRTDERKDICGMYRNRNSLHDTHDSKFHLSVLLGSQTQERGLQDENRAERERNNDNRRNKRNVFQWEGK